MPPMRWKKIKARIQAGLRWPCHKSSKGLRWLGVKLHIISPPAPPVAPATIVTEGKSQPESSTSSALSQAIHSSPAHSEAKMQAIAWPKDDEKKITVTRAFPLLNSSSILIQHQTELLSPLGLFNLKEKGSYF